LTLLSTDMKILQTSIDVLTTDWRHQQLTDYWSCTAFCCDIFLFVAEAVYSGSCDFYTVDVNTFLLGITYCLFHQTDILKQFFEWRSLKQHSAVLTLWAWRFSNIDISQGSVATRLRRGGIFKYCVTANFLLSPAVKEFWKSVNIWQSYGQGYGVLFFDLQWLLYLVT